jgi:hypothetical protein
MSTQHTPIDTLLGGFLLVTLGVVGIYDLVALGSGGRWPTVSVRMQVWSREYPLLPFAAGLLIGHLFFPAMAFPDKAP